MSGSKISLLIAVIIVVMFGVWWYGGQQAKVPEVVVAPVTKVVAPQTDVMQAAIKTSGSSDAALSQDVSAIDNELSSLEVDATNISQGISEIK